MGSVIVQSVIEDLVATQGLGSEAGARLLFSGCSAGAIGAMNNLERVIALVPPTVQVQGFLDGAALLDIYPAAWSWSDMLVPLQELMANLTLFANPVFPPYCAQLFGADTVRRRFCSDQARRRSSHSLSPVGHAPSLVEVSDRTIPHAAHHLCALLHQRAAV